MKHKRNGFVLGFTLVEVALFLAVTAVLFVGITTATQGSIWQQRYYDSVQNYAEFLRSLYSQVANPQSVGQGNSDRAIYGKLVVFGESYDLEGNEITERMIKDDGQQIFVYDVIGDVDDKMGTGRVQDLLGDVKAGVIIERGNSVTPAGDVQKYYPKWGASIEKLDKQELFTGSILITRHPRSGTINTLYSERVIEVNEMVMETNRLMASGSEALPPYKSILTEVLGMDPSNTEAFKTVELDFCINPYGFGSETNDRREVTVAKNARNASGVQIFDKDSIDNECNK